jgi:hypothetical protein
MTRKKRMKERRVDSRLRPHLLRNEWNEFAPDPDRRAKFCRELQQLDPEATAFRDYWTVYEAAVKAGYTSRHARRLAEQSWVLQRADEQEGE